MQSTDTAVRVATAAPDTAAADAPVARRDRLRSWLPLVAVAVLGALLVGLHVHTYRQLSVYDEVQHVDYVHRLLEGELVASGDRWVPATVDAVTCRTIDYPAEYPACGSDPRWTQLPNSGYTTAFIHPPTYYLGPTAVVALTDLVGYDGDRISLMRVTGLAWLVLALGLLWAMWRDHGVPWQARAGLGIALVATPAVLLAHATVTNDATSLAAGAAVTLATMRWDEGRYRLWVPVTVAVVALLLKATSLAVLLLACAFVLVRRVQRSDTVAERWRAVTAPKPLLFVGSLAAATAVIGVGWSALSRARASMDERLIPQNITLMAPGDFDPSWLTTSLLAMVSPLQPQFLQSAVAGGAAVIVANVANVGLLALAVVGAVRMQPGSALRALAIATGSAALAFGPLLTVVNYVTLGVQFGIPARYGFSLVPALLLVAAAAVRTRWGGTALLVVGAGTYLLTTWALLT